MNRERRIKRILYILYSVACAVSCYLIFYAAKNGTLYTPVFEQIKIKALILGIPAVCCLLIDMHYYPYELIEGPAWSTSIGGPFVCLLCGYLLIGSKQAVEIFGMNVPAKVIYILMYALAVIISYCAGLLSIYISDEPTHRHHSTHSNRENTTTTTEKAPGCGAYGFPEEKGPNHLPNNLKGPF